MQDSQLLTLIRTRKAHALKHYSAFLHQLARRYDLYRGFFRGNYAQFRNNIQLPTLFSIIQADVARKVQALLGGDRFIDFVARSSTDGSFARKVSSLVNAQLHDCNTVSKGQDFFLTADMYGTAFARHGWKTVRRLEQFRKLDETGQKEMIASGVVTRFDGPNWDVLDPLDVWPQPGRKRIEDCRWVMVRYFMDLDELELLSQVGVYDKAAVARLKSTSSPTGFVDDSYRIRRQLYRNMSDYDARMQEQYNKVVECVDMFGYVPDEFAPDGFTFRMITTGNDVVVLRNKPFPFWHGQIPIIAYSPMADPHYIHGVGKIEITERLQYLANRWVSQKADAVDLVIDPMWLVNRQAGVDTQNLYTRAGRVIGVDGAVDDSVIRPLSPDMRGLPLADQEIKGLWGWMQQSTGMIEDTMMGGPSSREQTATEYGGRTQAVLTRQMLELLLAGNLWLEPLANTFHQYNRQFLKMPKEVMLIGEDAEIDPITGLAQPPTMQQVGLQDLNMDYRAVSSGAANMIGKQARRNDIMALTGLLQQNPVAGQAMNWVAWLRYVMTVFDLPNTKDFFATGQVPGVNQVAESTGQSPESVVGMAGGRQPLVNMMMGGQGG